jgi:hypothetical protein
LNTFNFDAEPPEQKKTWKPVAAGIILLILGIYGLSRGIGRLFFNTYLLPSYYGTLGFEVPGIVLVIVSIVVFLGAVNALRRSIWDVAFAGAVFGLLSSWPLAIVVMILLWGSKEELL